MAWPPGTHLEGIITQAQTVLREIRIIRHDVSQSRAIIDFEGEWRGYRIIVSEIHRADRDVRYAYYVLDDCHQIVWAFDNSPDHLAIRQRYGMDWKAHLYAEIPHQHDSAGNLSLTPTPMTFDRFIAWLHDHFNE